MLKISQESLDRDNKELKNKLFVEVIRLILQRYTELRNNIFTKLKVNKVVVNEMFRFQEHNIINK